MAERITTAIDDPNILTWLSLQREPDKDINEGTSDIRAGVKDQLREEFKNGTLTGEKVAAFLKDEQGLNAVLNSDGTVTYDKPEDRPDTEGNMILGGLMAGVGALSGGFGFKELFGNTGLGNWVSETMGGWQEKVSSLFGDATPGASSIIEEAGNFTTGAAADAGSSALTSGTEKLIEGTTGVSTNPADVLRGVDSYASPVTEAATKTATGSKGLIDSVIQWGKENQGLASGLLQAGGGLLKGIGDRSTALEIADKKAASDSALLSQKTQEQINLENAKRGLIQSGSYFDAKLPVKPGANVLRRPDGSLVYTPGTGLIANAMRGS